MNGVALDRDVLESTIAESHREQDADDRVARRFDQCDDTCTTDCGACKGDHSLRVAAALERAAADGYARIAAHATPTTGDLATWLLSPRPNRTTRQVALGLLLQARIARAGEREYPALTFHRAAHPAALTATRLLLNGSVELAEQWAGAYDLLTHRATYRSGVAS